MKRFITATVCLSVLAVLMTSGTAFAAQGGYSLVLQVSPANGGVVTPAASSEGVYSAYAEENVTVSATPSPGYRFVYWLGDVGDQTANETSVSMNAPKMVVAVFERSDFDFSQVVSRSVSSPGGGGLRRSPSPISNNSTPSAAGGYVPDYPDFPDFPEDPEDPDEENPGDDLPVPGKMGEENPIPEPATVFIFGAGAVLVRNRKCIKKKR